MNQLKPMSSPDSASRTTIDRRSEGAPMLIHEALARSRQREAEREARQYRRARTLTAGRGWARLAAWAQRRAQAGRTRAGSR